MMRAVSAPAGPSKVLNNYKKATLKERRIHRVAVEAQMFKASAYLDAY